MNGQSPSWEAGETLDAGALQHPETSGATRADQGLGHAAGQGLEQDEAVRRLMTIPLGDPSGIADAQQRECASAYCATRARKCQSK